jgi:hypothetical protein
LTLKAMRETQVTQSSSVLDTLWKSLDDGASLTLRSVPKPEIKNYLLEIWKHSNQQDKIHCIVWSNNQLVKLKIEGEKIERNFRRKAVEEYFIELSKTTNHHQSFHLLIYWKFIYLLLQLSDALFERLVWLFDFAY